MEQKKLCYPVFLFIVGYHLLLAIALPIYFLNHTPTITLLITTLSLVFISGIAVTTGYHRLYSHNCFKIHPIPEAILLFFSSLATQGSALRWAHDHRLHHAHIDTDQDPYSVTKGMWHAHVLWMFYKSKDIDTKVISDLSRKKMLRFQHKYYVLCMLGSNLITSLVAGYLLNDYLGAFLFVWVVRLFFLHHTTWCINSLAHYWGSQNYSQEHTAVDNYLISLLTYGEGYHNYHHTFAYDYRNGIRWYHFDPTKWLIWTLYKLGLARDLKTVNNYRIARHLVLQHKDELLQKIKESATAQRVTEIAENLSTKLSQMQTMLDPSQIRDLKKSLKQDWREWKRVIRAIHKNSPQIA